MEEEALLVFVANQAPPPLRIVRDALLAAGAPASIGVDIAGEATEEQLEAPDWEAAFVRWHEPEIHEVLLIERAVRGEEDAEDAITQSLRRIVNTADTAGQLIVSDHLRRTRAVYIVQILPAMVAEDDHPAWDALDTLLQTLAQEGNGLIYVPAEGFYDADGEMMLAEDEDDEGDKKDNN